MKCEICDRADCPRKREDCTVGWEEARAICNMRAVAWRAEALAAKAELRSVKAELAELRERLLDSIADNRQAATQSVNMVPP